MRTRIENVRLVQDGQIRPAVILVNGEKVEAVLPAGAKPEAEAVIDGGGRYLSHGFVDIHTHGGGGHDFMDATEEAYLGAAKMHASHGTTGLAVTTLAASKEEILESFRQELRRGVDAAVFTYVSNVFGYILPVEKLAALCREAEVPFILDAAQAAGSLKVSMELGADFIAMPGHKGLLGPQGTGLLLCGQPGKPLLYGGTGSQSRSHEMPQDLPERLEPGTLNVPGAAGLAAGISIVERKGTDAIFRREHTQAEKLSRDLRNLGFRVFSGEHQAGTVSFQGRRDCEEIAAYLGKRGIAVRAGLHCAPLAHESAGTIAQGTVRVSFGHEANDSQRRALVKELAQMR